MLNIILSPLNCLIHQHWLPEAELDRVLATYDKNGNGTIEFEEFQSIVSHPLVHGYSHAIYDGYSW